MANGYQPSGYQPPGYQPPGYQPEVSGGAGGDLVIEDVEMTVEGPDVSLRRLRVERVEIAIDRIDVQIRPNVYGHNLSGDGVDRRAVA